MKRTSHALRSLSVFLPALLCFGSIRVDAAIAFDSVSSAVVENASSISWSHTLVAGSGNNRLLIVGIATENLSGAAAQVISTVKFNNVSLSLVSGSTVNNTVSRVDMYQLADASLPASAGTYTVQVTFAASVTEITAGAIALTGASQGTREAVATNTAVTTTTIATSLTTVSNNAWVVSVLGSGDTFAFTTADSTERLDTVTATSRIAASTKLVTTAGSTTVTWTAAGTTNRLAQSSAAFGPAGSAITISGTVFEDVGYAGGAGRSNAASSGAVRSGARVELFTAAGNYSTFATTDASGNYSLGAAASTSYTIRVVNSTVTSSLGGTSLLPVQTYRTTGTSGSAVAVTDRVGGEDPTKADAGNGSTTLAALTSGSVTPQSITSVTTSASSISGLDFGFNFNTVVNDNNTAQGSLRQFITNANGMSGTQTSVFMISDGSAHPGLRAGLTNQLTSGVAVITLASALPQITGTLTLDGTSQTTNIGNTNAGALGTGGTVGADAVSLSTVGRPEVELVGTSSIATGLNITAAGTTIKGIALHGFGSLLTDGDIVIAASSVTITQCVIGTTASSFSLPGSNSTGGTGISITSGSSGAITNSLIGYVLNAGARMVSNTSSGWTISNNEVRGVGLADGARNGLTVRGSSHAVSGNLVVDCKGFGISTVDAGSSSTTIVNNTVTGCGVGTVGTLEIAGVVIIGSGHTVDRNKIHANRGSGVQVAAAATGNKITRNSIYANGTITNDSAAAATGAIGIDLQVTGNDTRLGTPPYYTLNDSGDGDSGGNAALNFPVLATAAISGANLLVTGWARAGSVIELFISDSDPSGFGEGQTYLTSLTEGSGSDTDVTSTAYSNPVNGLNQGGDTTNRFAFSLALPGSVVHGAKLTATATDGSNNTSEFSGQVTVTTIVGLTGTVYEDVSYAGGAGRDRTTAAGSDRAGARVELFTAAGNYSTFTTTDTNGDFSFTGLAASTSYTIRVVNSSVTSSLGGTSLLPVQTWRTTATGTVTAVTDRVGGEDPAKADAGNGSTTLAALTAGSLTPQSITACTTNTGTKSGIDFGFNFNTIVNANNTGQGSLRQMITNSSGMSGTQTSIFMITDGSAHAGLRAGLTNQLTSGVAVITVASQLPTPSDAIVFDATTQTTNIGNTNSGTMGTGGTVGVDGLTLSTVNRPEVELVGNSGIGSGILMGQHNSTLKGFAIHGFGAAIGQGDVVVGGTGLTITQNVIGTTATSFSLPGSAQSGGSALRVNPATGTISNNLIGFTAYHGILFYSGANTLTISNNEFRGCGRSGGSAGMLLAGTGHAISQNLFVAIKGNGIDIDATASASSAQSMVNNTFTGNGVGTVGTRAIAAIRLYGNTNVVDRNIITGSYGPGVLITSGSTDNKFTRNSISSNGTITNDGAQSATGQVGIDLLSATDLASTGTAPYYTINDNTDADTGANNRLNFPVLATAVINGSNLTVTGWARPGSVIECFIADSDPSGFGEGQTYLTSLTEGGGSDTDATTGSYSNPVNGLNQGTDNTNLFSFTFVLPGGVSAGTKLTATATDGSNYTSEFSGVVTVALGTTTLSGNVFEDVTYAGGIGRDKAAAAGSNRAGARVELYTAAGAYSTFTTTDVAGNYSLSVTPSASYTLRVVNSTVTSSLGGTSLVPVQTYRTTATTGSAVAVTDRVGGEDPAKADAGNGSTTLAALTAGSVTPQSITAVTAGTSDITGLDFGFNFSTIVNNNDSAQGSLRQFITNANGMSGEQASVFMISDGAAHAGLRTGLTNQLTSGVAVITLATVLPSISTTLTLDGTSQTTNVGNTNSGTFGAGGTVGVDAATLSTVNRPEVEISVPSTIATALNIAANSVTIIGVAIHGSGSAATNASIAVSSGTSVTITQNLIGSTATSLAAAGTNPTMGEGVYAASATSGTISNNLIGYVAFNGINLATGSTGWQISNNELRGCGTQQSTHGGIYLLGSSHTISGNLLIANKGQGIDGATDANNGHTILNNTVTGNGVGIVGTRETAGIDLTSDNNTVDRNIVYANYGAGVLIGSTGTGNKITRNSIYGNGTMTNDGAAAAAGEVGIDLLASTDSQDLGTSPFLTLNDSGDADSGGNNRFNTPVIDTATIVGANLELTGWVSAGSIVEFFVSDEHASGFGSGQTFIGTFTEGGGDLDVTSGSYSGNVNCFAQGSDAGIARFKFAMAKPGSVSIGTRLTATTTDFSNNTSEFCGNTTVHSNIPSFTLVKNAQTISDPVNATTNPKAIPGSITQYSTVVTNSSAALSDTDSFVFTDPVPADIELYVGDLGGPSSGPVLFVDGATSCKLTYTFTNLSSTTDSLSFSNNNGTTWTYVPTPDADGFDANVTNIQIAPTGSFAKATCGNNPSFTLQLRMRVL